MKTQDQIINEVKKYPKFNGTYKKELAVKDFFKLKNYPSETVLLRDIFPLANAAYPSKFNLSVSEYLWSEMCKERGFIIKKGVFDYTALPEHSFWTITRNIRDEDFEKILSGSEQHLLLFHIIAVSGFSITNTNENNRKFYLENMITFLSNYFSLSKLKISYFPGGNIEKHSIKKDFAEDINKGLYQSLSKKFGFSIFPTNEETFLSLKVFGSPIFWGYRNEFFVKTKKSTVDVGTIECLPFIPKYSLKNGEIEYSDIISSKKIFIGSGVGLERIMMVTEGVDNIWDISTIKPLVDFFKKKSENKVSDRKLFLLSESLKVLHYLVSENGGLTAGELGNKHRREIVSKYLTLLTGCLCSTGLSVDKNLLKEFFECVKKFNPVDKDILSDYDKAIPILYDVILEQLRMYKTSEKYREKVNSLMDRII